MCQVGFTDMEFCLNSGCKTNPSKASLNPLMPCVFSRPSHFSVLSGKYSNKQWMAARSEGDEHSQSRWKCFDFISWIASMRWGRGEAEEDGLTFDRWRLVNPWVQHYLHAYWLTALVSPPPPLSLFSFSVSFAELADKAPVSVRRVFFSRFFFPFSSLATGPWCILEFRRGGVKMLCNTCNICHGRSASLSRN